MPFSPNFQQSSTVRPLTSQGKSSKPTYHLWQAKTIRDPLPNVRRAHFSPYLALVQFTDKTAPEGICLIALLDGPVAQPWLFEGWRIDNGAAVEIEHLVEYYRFPMQYSQTPQTIRTAMIEGFKFTMQKQGKAAAASGAKK